MRLSAIALVLLLLWCVLSGKLDALHLGLGAGSATAVAVVMSRGRASGSIRLLGLPGYVLYLAAEIVVSNLRVARLVLVSGEIRPRLVEASPEVSSDRAMCVLGCSITLTPGTVTVEMTRERVIVHVLDEASAADLEKGRMAERVRRLFHGEEEVRT